MGKVSIAIYCFISIAIYGKQWQRCAFAFVTPLASRNGRTTTVIFGTDGTETQLETPLLSNKYDIYDAHFRDYITYDDARKEDLGNLLSVCKEVQDSPDYQPAKWADSCTVISQQRQGSAHPTVIATRDVKKGDVLTLVPIHALGLINEIDGAEFHEFSSERKEQLFNAGDAVKLNVPLNRYAEIQVGNKGIDCWNDPAAAVVGKNPAIRLFAISFPCEEVVPGWLGGVVKTIPSEEEANCINIPLLNASPFCAIVATCDIKEGDELIRAEEISNWDLEEELQEIVDEYRNKDLLTLRNHLRRAFVDSFHQINMDYPGLKKIHSDPDIYEIRNFLTDDECDRMISKIRPNLENKSIYIERKNSFAENKGNNYKSVRVPSREIPTLVNKLTTMADCGIENVGYSHCIHYEEGKAQRILPHVDHMQYTENRLFKTSGEEKTVCYEHHCTAIVFCYLNDVEDGGDTYFNNIDLHVKPTRGTALIHFPSDLDGRPDHRTMHEGSPAKDEKWLIAMTLYNTTEITHEFLEFQLDPLSNDVI